MADIHNDAYSKKRIPKYFYLPFTSSTETLNNNLINLCPPACAQSVTNALLEAVNCHSTNIFVVYVIVTLMALDIQAHEDYIGCRFRWIVKFLSDIG